ncbi:MAG: SDR family oxidoreductase [Desulfobacterales bacterium]
MNFNNQTVVITGGTSGMGRSTAKRFAQLSANVVFTGRDKAKGEQVSEEIKALKGPGETLFVHSDVSRADEVASLAQLVADQCGGCDILVNNAGIFTGGLIHETTEDDWNQLMAVNVTGIYLMCRHFLPQMLAKGKGAVINNSSVSGLRGEYNMAAYTATKGAVSNLTRSMALDYADQGIRVNCVCPSATRTPMFLTGSTDEIIEAFNAVFPPRRVGEPEEVANLIVFLASDEASFLNGLNVPVDGGLLSHSGQPRQMKEE